MVSEGRLTPHSIASKRTTTPCQGGSRPQIPVNTHRCRSPARILTISGWGSRKLVGSVWCSEKVLNQEGIRLIRGDGKEAMVCSSPAATQVADLGGGVLKFEDMKRCISGNLEEHIGGSITTSSCD